MPSQTLLARIHIGKKDLGLTDPEYRGLLRSVIGKESSKGITDADALKVIAGLKLCGWRPDKKKPANESGPKRFEDYGFRPGMATPPQLRKIHATWMTHPKVRWKTDAGLNHYIKRLFKIDNLRFIPSNRVGKILLSIKNIK